MLKWYNLWILFIFHCCISQSILAIAENKPQTQGITHKIERTKRQYCLLLLVTEFNSVFFTKLEELTIKVFLLKNIAYSFVFTFNISFLFF